MSNSVINLLEVKRSRKANLENKKMNISKDLTLKFATNINLIVSDFPIDPIHQATLLMAKAIDVLAMAGPVPSTIDDQHKRSENLLRSVMTARSNLMEKSVRILYSEDIGSQFPLGETFS